MFDLYSVSSLANAADMNLLDKAKQFDKDELKAIYESSSKHFNEDEYTLTPCRFAELGWKYVKRASVNKYLNHPNKVNSVGYQPKSHSSLSKY